MLKATCSPGSCGSDVVHRLGSGNNLLRKEFPKIRKFQTN